MPAPIPAWTAFTPVTAKSLDLACYTSDGTADNPSGIAFHCFRPVLFDAYGTAATLPATSSGTQTSLAGSGITTPASVIYDTAGYYGAYQDQPAGTGYYQYLAAVKGSSGDGVTPGGWCLLSHFAAIAAGTHLTSVSADLTGTGQAPVAGTRQAPSTTRDSTPFFLDLVDVTSTVTWAPAVTIAASSGNASLVVNTTDASGETCRFTAMWAAVSATSAGQAFFPNSVGSPYNWVAPQGVTQVTVSAFAAGGGGGGGASSASEFGGGGGGGGEYAQGTLTVTPGTSYAVTVGAGGPGGAGGGSSPGTPGTAGTSGGQSLMVGDGGAQVVANGGAGGGGATLSANGAGGAGGTGSSAAIHHRGGAGAAGSTSLYGGAGGSSAGTGHNGTTATGPNPPPAPSGGGPGGAGGTQAISIVQTAHGAATGTSSLTVSFNGTTQAGNSVLAFVYYQGTAPAGDPTVTLSDGSQILTNQVNADVTARVPLQVGLYDCYNISGGQTGISIRGHGTDNSTKVVLCEMYEVAGLGPQPQIDASNSHTQGPTNPDVNYTFPATTTTHAPDLWVGFTAGQFTAPFTINDPFPSQGWTGIRRRYADNGGVFAGILTANQVATSPGSLKFSGTFSRGVTKGTLGAAYTTSALTTGSTPIIGPSGGGGGGLGAGNAGGSGYDGQVTLTWTAPSGSGYGNPPLPAPYSAWTTTTTVGTTAAATVNINGPTGITDVLNFLSNPPVFRIGDTATDTIPSNTPYAVQFGFTTTPTVNNYPANFQGSFWIVTRPGLYLLHGVTAFTANATGVRQTGFGIGPSLSSYTIYWGPAYGACATGDTIASKTGIFSLQAGDIVQLIAWQSSGGTLNRSTTDPTRFFAVWLGESGAPASLWTPPDTSFRWQSGTRGENLGGNLSELLQTHLGNDLGFLVNRPYLMAYQTIAQTGLPVGTFSTAVLDTVGGIVHGDNGDNYSGWAPGTGNAYAAPVPGWWLTVGEIFTAAAGSNGTVITAGILPSASGGTAPSQTPDWYQSLQSTTSASNGGGATIFGLYYLQTGETLTPQVQKLGTSNYGTLVGTQNGGQFNSHMEMIWISE